MILFKSLTKISAFEELKKILREHYSDIALNSMVEIRANGQIYTPDS